MNFVLISPVGADVDLMPKTRPGQMTGTSVSTPTPWRDVHRLLLPHRVIRLSRITNTLTILSVNGRTLLAGRTRTRFSRACQGICFLPAPLLPVHYLLPYQQSTSTFTATYATRHIITTTIWYAAGCGRRRQLTTDHRLSAAANDMSLLLESDISSRGSRILAFLFRGRNSQ